jgi:hypothetical protein
MANPLDGAYPVHRESQSIGKSEDIFLFHRNFRWDALWWKMGF